MGGEGEGGPVGGEGEGGRLGLFSSPLPGLFSSPLPGLFSPLLPGTLGLITGASAGEQTLGGHSRPEADGREISFASQHYFTLYQALPWLSLQEPQQRWLSRSAVRAGSFWLQVRFPRGRALRSRGARGRATRARACALLQGEARRGVARRGAARRAAAARVRCFCSGEAWLARRMMPHAEKSLVTHRGGSEPEQATCRMTVRRRFFSSLPYAGWG